MKFYGNDVILSSKTAEELYESVKNNEIIDYHCHLNAKDIMNDKHFDDIGELWLAGDHYKWRVMRICGVDEKYITGNDSSYKEKFLKFAEIMPKILGNPVYYWVQLELKEIFGIEIPLNKDTAEEIYNDCNKKLKSISVSVLLNRFNVKFIGTTDDPIDDLQYHGKTGNVILAPTFRPDKAFIVDNDDYFCKLSKVSGICVTDVKSLLNALENRMDYFIGKGCRMTDHALQSIPDYCDLDTAERIFTNRHSATAYDRELFQGFMLTEMAKRCRAKKLIMQWHFSAVRNVNSKMYRLLGPDTGYDVFDNPTDPVKLVKILDKINTDGGLPKIILYSLNPDATKVIAAISGAFCNVYLGTAWWFNDTLEGTRDYIKTVMEYSVLGTQLGMLTDSRSFTSYVRHDFFRRILADVLGNLVEKGECDKNAAMSVMQDVVTNNIRNLIFDK